MRKATTVLAALTSDPGADPSTMGDASLLPAEAPLMHLHTPCHMFGEDFAEALGRRLFGIFQPSEKPVDATIALSIAFVARELIMQRPGERRLSESYPWVVALPSACCMALDSPAP